MTSEAFQQGFVALTAAFPGLQFNSNLLWRTLSDLDGEVFLKAVIEIVKTTKELYPGSNIIAIIRSKAEELANERSKKLLRIGMESEKQRLERWNKEATPMPEDCRIALAKLGINLKRGKDDKCS